MIPSRCYKGSDGRLISGIPPQPSGQEIEATIDRLRNEVEISAAKDSRFAKDIITLCDLVEAQQQPSGQEKWDDGLQRYLFDHRHLWFHNFPEDKDDYRHLHFVDCVIDALRKQLLAIPQGNYGGFNRYDTDDQLVLHVWSDGKSFDIRAPKKLETYYETPFPRR